MRIPIMTISGDTIDGLLIYLSILGILILIATILRLKIPAFTVEAGDDSLSHPLGGEALEDIVTRNAGALAVLAKELR